MVSFFGFPINSILTLMFSVSSPLFILFGKMGYLRDEKIKHKTRLFDGFVFILAFILLLGGQFIDFFGSSPYGTINSSFTAFVDICVVLYFIYNYFDILNGFTEKKGGKNEKYRLLIKGDRASRFDIVPSFVVIILFVIYCFAGSRFMDLHVLITITILHFIELIIYRYHKGEPISYDDL